MSIKFSELGLSDPIINALNDMDYETPSPIQAEAIPPLLAGQDIIGQAQTGTGKTAAFALPLLNNLDTEQETPQILVLAPTRELAIQVSESFKSYAKHIRNLHVLPIYGGQSYSLQLKGLKRKPQILVGTPGRVLDHLNRGTLKIGELRGFVLDEADEMLNMGFIDDIKQVVEKIPKTCQIAMFSATMPKPIRNIATTYLKDPIEIKIAAKTTTVEKIDQSFIRVNHSQKLDVLTRILEAIDFDGVIIFARTKSATVDVAEKLDACGFSAAALNGDMNQAAREKTIKQLKSNKLDIVVATDVAARGLDVDRLTLVINYDIPQDPEPYVHRIGRTGRAGREGRAILFVTPRENRLLSLIEKSIGQKIVPMVLPSSKDVEQRRMDQFKNRIINVFGHQNIGFFTKCAHQLSEELNMSLEEIAPALLCLAQEEQPLQIPKGPDIKLPEGGKDRKEKKGKKERKPKRSQDLFDDEDFDYSTFRLAVGRKDNIQVGNIVGALANEAGLDSQYIRNIKLKDTYTLVDLPAGMPKELLNHLKNVRVGQRKLNIKASDD